MRILLAITLFAACTAAASDAPRARDLGIPFDGTPGELNTITDVAGVTVGHVTLIEDLEDNKAVRTGVPYCRAARRRNRPTSWPAGSASTATGK